LLDLLLGKGGTKISPFHRIAATGDLSRLTLELMVGRQGGSQGPACVSGSGLNPNVFEIPIAQDLSIGYSVESDAARHTKVLNADSAASDRVIFRSTWFKTSWLA
jgi:hypothetical protein